MSCLLYAKDDDTQRQVNIEELYEKEQKRSLKMLSTFNKLLNRVHKRIQTVARSKYSDKHVFFNVPEFILGEPNYDNAHCIAFLVTQLEENEFVVKYIHPNTLYISWNSFVPSFIRDQVKRKTGLVIDTRGKPVIEEQEEGNNGTRNEIVKTGASKSEEPSKYKSTEVYKPTGQFVYGSDLFDKIDKRVNR